MRELEKRLAKELQRNIKVKILESTAWSIPIQTIEVEYKPVKRTKMDVLMKMMLLSFQKAEFGNPEELSELLLVDQLFIEDIIHIMTRTGLIEKRENIISLTAKGLQQLENGIFEEEQETKKYNLLFSPCHDAILQGEIKPALDGEENLKLYRYLEKERITKFASSMLAAGLKDSGVESEEGGVQTVVSEIISTSELYIDDIPCLEFLLYNKEEDLLYARVWNTLLEQWDEKLETQLNEKERVQWRKRYLDN